ncbi:MAG: OmpA family protein [Rhodocyclales bacterium]|nr:OmpA family protein [Rhodocyclales bacterium]
MHFSLFSRVDRKSRQVALLALSVLALSACAPKSYVVLLPDADGKVGQVVVRGEGGEQVLTKAREGVSLKADKAPEIIEQARIDKDFGAAMAARPILPKRFILYFQSGGVELTAESQALLPEIKKAVEGRPAADISVIGHSDTVGKAETNESLALKRAQAIATMLTEQGVKPLAMLVESHGERNLLVQTPDETPEPRNRRVEISVR